ncbi:MAG: conjugative relaxase [Nevskia sp.]|nr:conjugative relaxase [Nevskia sp.]
MALAKNIGAAQADRYYDKDDYYTKDAAAPSAWHGEGAAALGLSGPVQPDDFKALVRGELPDGTQLHRGGSGERRAGTDFEFSAPKSFSIQALVMGDDRLVRAHQEAVAIARERIEATTATRVMRDGQQEVEFTGRAVIAEFLHTTSRAGDPDLHSHVVALNLTQRQDGQWRSVDNTAMFKEQRLMYEIYLSELAQRARTLGYEITTGKHGNPELAHITREQIEQFSSRGNEIEAALAAQGLTLDTATAKQKKAATLSTRKAKQDYNREELGKVWRERAAELGIKDPAARERTEQRSAPGGHTPDQQAAREAVSFALKHLGEREAAFERRELLAVALRESRGSSGYHDIDAELKRRQQQSEVLASRSQERLTTPEALKIERRILQIERDGRNALKPIAAPEAVARHLSDARLTVGQAQAVELAATSPHRVNGIQGYAGSGKTTALHSFKSLAKEHGYQLIGLAPSHSAVKALNGAGIESRTLQGWLSEKDDGKALSERSIVVLDEAGLVGNRNLLSTLERAEKHGARVLLVGDTKQYQAVEAGRGFGQLQQHGMATARMTEILRQKNGRLAQAARLSVDEPAKALSRLEVREIADAGERHRRIALDYAEQPRTVRDSTLILTGTNEARAELNRTVRDALKARGELSGQAATVRTFQRKDLTIAEQKRLDRYRVGDAVLFRRAYRSLGVERGEIYQVTRIGSDRVHARSDDGKEIAFGPANLSGKGLSLGRIEGREVAPGEGLRMTDTDRTLGVRNGERGMVHSVSPGAIELRSADGGSKTLRTDRVLPLEYSYAATGHSAQGLGADRVLLDKDTKARTTDHRSFYTDLTRAKHAAIVYTNDRSALPQAIARQSQKTAALDAVKSRDHGRRGEHHTANSTPPPAPTATRGMHNHR